MEKNEREAPLIWIPGGNREPETPPREEQEFSIPRELPLLPTRDVVAFPFMILPLFVGREASIKAVDEALSRDRLIFLVAQKRAEIEEPTPQDIHQVGTVGMIMRMLKLPDGRIKILVQGLAKGRIEEFTQIQPFYRIRISILEEPEIKETTLETEALVRSVREGLEKAVSLGKAIPPDLVVVVNNLEDPGKLADLVASNLGLKVEDAQQILETLNPMDRLKRVAQILYRE
ncbi:MAG TPA: endopeptidase La, partial [Thermosulfidibacter takaii]|nr:endopeptidase La [Thermosulfidibacter takaii]